MTNLIQVIRRYAIADSVTNRRIPHRQQTSRPTGAPAVVKAGSVSAEGSDNRNHSELPRCSYRRLTTATNSTDARAATGRASAYRIIVPESTVVPVVVLVVVVEV